MTTCVENQQSSTSNRPELIHSRPPRPSRPPSGAALLRVLRLTGTMETTNSDRAIDKLKSDIMSSSHWMVDPRAGMSSSAMLTSLQRAKKEIEAGLKSLDHEYNYVTTYFMYSAVLGCPVMLERKTPLPHVDNIMWEHKYYYVKTPIKVVQDIFAQCSGKVVTSLKGC
jgi:hypothetical protein